MYDEFRGKFIRSIATENGVCKRWKEHITASLRNSPTNQKAMFDSSYTSSDYIVANTPPSEVIKGTFSRLVQVLGIGFESKNVSEIIALFQ